MGRLVINGEEVYELDEDCLKEKYSSKVQAAFRQQERGRFCPPEMCTEIRAFRTMGANGVVIGALTPEDFY